MPYIRSSSFLRLLRQLRCYQGHHCSLVESLSLTPLLHSFHLSQCSEALRTRVSLASLGFPAEQGYIVPDSSEISLYQTHICARPNVACVDLALGASPWPGLGARGPKDTGLAHTSKLYGTSVLRAT